MFAAGAFQKSAVASHLRYRTGISSRQDGNRRFRASRQLDKPRDHLGWQSAPSHDDQAAGSHFRLGRLQGRKGWTCAGQGRHSPAGEVRLFALFEGDFACRTTVRLGQADSQVSRTEDVDIPSLDDDRGVLINPQAEEVRSFLQSNRQSRLLFALDKVGFDHRSRQQIERGPKRCIGLIVREQHGSQ